MVLCSQPINLWHGVKSLLCANQKTATKTELQFLDIELIFESCYDKACVILEAIGYCQNMFLVIDF